MEGKASSGHDATDANGVGYQIKGRRLTPRSISRQVSAIRGLHLKPFDHLAGLLVDEQFRILRAAIVPFEVVQAKATFVHHTNAHRFLLRDEIWAAPGVRDVTEDLRGAAAAF